MAGILHLMASLCVHSSPSFRIFGRAFLCDFLDKQTNYIAHDGCRVFALLESIQVNLVFIYLFIFGKSAISWFSYYHLILLIRKRHALTAKHFHYAAADLLLVCDVFIAVIYLMYDALFSGLHFAKPIWHSTLRGMTI